MGAVMKLFLSHLVQWEWLVLLAFLPVVMVIKLPFTPLLLLIPLLWGGRWWATGRLTPATPLNGALWLLLLLTWFNFAFVTYDRALSVGKVALITHNVALFWAVVTAVAPSRRRLWRMMALFFLLNWLVVGLGFIGTKWSVKFPLIGPFLAQIPTLLPASIDLFNPNQIAGTLLWCAPLAFTLSGVLLWCYADLHRVLRARQIRFLQVVAVLTAGLTCGLLLLTQSRGGLLGFALGCVGLVWLASGRAKPWLLGGAGLLGLLTAGLVGWFGLEILTPLTQPLGLTITNDPAADSLSTLNGRLEIWSRGVYVMQDFPFTGLGLNIFRSAVHPLYPLLTIHPSVDIAHTHNQFLDVGVALGMPGLLAYLMVWLGWAGMLGQMWRVAHRPLYKGLTAGFFAVYLAALGYGLFDTVALGSKPSFFFWLMLALCTAGHEQMVKHQLASQMAETTPSDARPRENATF